jgi:hypothetical protein
MIRKRRTLIKNFIIICSIWVKNYFKQRQIFNFIQNLSLFYFSVNLPSYNIFGSISPSILNQVGAGKLLNLNMVFSKSSLIFFLKNLKLKKIFYNSILS